MLQDKITTDMKSLLKSDNKEKLNIIRLLISEFQRKPNPHEKLTDKEVINIITKLIKSEKELLQYKNQTNSYFIEVLEQYLPTMLTKEQLENILKEKYNDIISLDKNQRIKHMGKIINDLGNNVDGKTLKSVLMDI